MPKQWESYEDVAAYLLNQFAQEFGVEAVEGKQTVEGQLTSWEIDAKGINTPNGGFMIVECKRWGNRIPQHVVGNLAFAIIDTGATGGIIVSPVGLQTGAKRIADGTGIFEVRLNRNSTRHEFAMQFLNKFAVGVSTTFYINGTASCTVEPASDKPAESQPNLS